MHYYGLLLHPSIAVFVLFTLVQALPKSCIVKESQLNVDFCQLQGRKHLGCNNEGTWSKKCGDIKFIVFMSKDYRNTIVNFHNQYRNTIAKGGLKGIPTAARMQRLRWDNNLAKLADYAVRLCSLKQPSKIISTPRFRDPGFNAAYTKFPRKEFQNEKLILKSHLKKWYEQYQYLDYRQLKADSSPTGKETFHIKQMAIGRNGAIGCAISRFTDKNWIYQLTICLYGCRKMENKRPYLVSKVPGDNCICGVGTDFKHLCHQGEPVGDCSYDKPPNLIIEETTTTRRPMIRKTKKKLQSQVGRLFDWILGNQSMENDFEYDESFEGSEEIDSQMDEDSQGSQLIEEVENSRED